MSKLNLNIKLKHIRKLELNGQSFADVLQKGVMGICDLLTACDKTDEEIENMLKEYGMEELSILVCEELQEAGFLPKMKKGVREMIQEQSQKPSVK